MFQDWMWNTCAWSAEDQRDWIKTNLGPTLEAAGLRRLQLMVLDHNRDALPWYPATVRSCLTPGGSHRHLYIAYTLAIPTLAILTHLPLAQILEDPETNKYVDGTAIHWYDDDNTGPEVMDQLHALFEDKFLLYTESCDGESRRETKAGQFSPQYWYSIYKHQW